MEQNNAAAAATESSLSSESSESLSESLQSSHLEGQSLEAQEAAIDADDSLSRAEKAEAKRTLKNLKIKFIIYYLSNQYSYSQVSTLPWWEHVPEPVESLCQPSSHVAPILFAVIFV